MCSRLTYAKVSTQLTVLGCSQLILTRTTLHENNKKCSDKRNDVFVLFLPSQTSITAHEHRRITSINKISKLSIARRYRTQ